MFCTYLCVSVYLCVRVRECVSETIVDHDCLYYSYVPVVLLYFFLILMRCCCCYHYYYNIVVYYYLYMKTQTKIPSYVQNI